MCVRKRTASFEPSMRCWRSRRRLDVEGELHRNAGAQRVEVHARLLRLLPQHREPSGVDVWRNAQLNTTGHRSKPNLHIAIHGEAATHVDVARDLYLEVED